MINLTRRLRHRLPPSLLPTPNLNRALSAPITPTPKPKPEVPVASHTEPQRRSGAGAAARTTPTAAGEVGREAVAFDGGVVPGLTPTMARFTLGGKVAVVTG